MAALLAACLCHAPSCACDEAAPLPAALALETYTHIFITCPVVSPAVEWLRDVWRRIGGAGPPADPLVLVVGDPRVWQPGQPHLRRLWLHLRLRFLRAVWGLRCARITEGRAFAAEAIVAVVAADLERDMRQDWLRVQHDIRRRAAVPAHWFAGSAPALSLRVFQQRWCSGGVLARVEDRAGEQQLVVCIPRGLPRPEGL